MPSFHLFSIFLMVASLASAAGPAPRTYDWRTQSINLPHQASGVDRAVPQVRREPEKVLRVLLDPGHGGRDLGAQAYGITEKLVTLDLAFKVRRELERAAKINGYPISVQMSRELDTALSLKDRVILANDWGADLFVSLHLNSSPVQKARGMEVYFLSPEASDPAAERLALKENSGRMPEAKPTVLSILSDVRTNFHMNESSEFAQTMYSVISSSVFTKGRGVRQGPFTVLHGTNMPAILIEAGYVTSPLEAKNLRSENYLKRLAGAISAGIIEYGMKLKKLG